MWTAWHVRTAAVIKVFQVHRQLSFTLSNAKKIMDYIGSDYLQEPKDRVLSPEFKLPKYFELFVAQFEVCIANKVFQDRFGGLAPAVGRAQHSQANHCVIAANEFSPGIAIRIEAGLNQFSMAHVLERHLDLAAILLKFP